MLIYILLAINALLAVAFLVIFVFYKKLIARGKEYLLLESKVKEAEKFIETAEIQARENIEKSSRKSSEIIEKAKLFGEDLQGDFESILRESFDVIRGEVSGLFESASKDFIEEARRDMKTFSVNLHSETENIKGVITDGIVGAIKKAEEGVEVYRSARMKNIEKEVKEKVDSLAREVLGKSLDTADQMNLVIESLNRAKKENVL